jgi:hypothetical protein
MKAPSEKPVGWGMAMAWPDVASAQRRARQATMLPSPQSAYRTFFNRSNHHEQEPGQQESSEERTRQEPQGKKGSEEGKEGSQQAAMMR